MSQEVNSSSAVRTVMDKLHELNNYLNATAPATQGQKIACDVYKIAKPVFIACAAAATVKLCLSAISFSIVFSAGALTGALLSSKKEDLKNADKSALVILTVAAVALIYFQPLFCLAAAATAGSVLYFGKEDKVQTLLDKLPSWEGIKAKLDDIKEFLSGLRAANTNREDPLPTEEPVPSEDTKPTEETPVPSKEPMKDPADALTQPDVG